MAMVIVMVIAMMAMTVRVLCVKSRSGAVPGGTMRPGLVWRMTAAAARSAVARRDMARATRESQVTVAGPRRGWSSQRRILSVSLGGAGCAYRYTSLWVGREVLCGPPGLQRTSCAVRVYGLVLAVRYSGLGEFFGLLLVPEVGHVAGEEPFTVPAGFVVPEAFPAECVGLLAHLG